MAIVEIQEVQTPVIIHAEDLTPGQMGVVVESPIDLFLGWVLVGGNICEGAVFFSLNTGDYWEPTGSTGIKVRVLRSYEIVTLRNS
jgi:hypothetical protein